MDETTEFGIVEMGPTIRVKSKRSVKLPIPISGLSPISAMPTWKVSVATKILSQPKSPLRLSFTENGPVFVNTGDPLLMQLSRDHKRYTYGQEGDLLKGEIKQTVPYLVYSLKTRKDLYVKTHLVRRL